MTIPGCEQEDIDFTDCGCSFGDSETVNVRGKGSDENPTQFLFNFDPDENNIAECGTYGEGLFAQMADRFVWPTMRKVRDIPVPLDAAETPVIPFTTVEYDPYGMSTTFEVARIPFDGKWRVTSYMNTDNNNGTYNTLRLEFNKGAAYGIMMASREQRDPNNVHESFVSLTDEFAMRAGDRIRMSLGEDAKEEKATGLNPAGVVWVKRASFVVTLVSL